MKEKLILGSRGSRLALWQTRFTAHLLQSFYPTLELEIKIIETTGDAILETALSKIGDKGLFTKQIEEKLLNGEIDLAVHSLKDLPTTLPEGLQIGAVLEREVPNDVLIAKNSKTIDDLPLNARVATGSLRRKSQLLAYRADLQISEIRGNVPTRIKKFEDSNLDAIILAFAGVHRLELDSYISQIIPPEIMLPAVAQGVVGVEIRTGDVETQKLLEPIIDTETEICITAERAFLRALEGGCQVPIGGFARLNKEEILLEGFVGNFDGSRTMRDKISGNSKNAAQLGKDLAERMIENGANELLSERAKNRKIRAGMLFEMKKEILVVREPDIFTAILTGNNLPVLNLPLIETKACEDLREFEARLETLGKYDGIFLTSRSAAQILADKLREKNINFNGKVYVLGAKSFEVLQMEKLNLIFFEAANTAREMLEKIPPEDLKGKKFLFVRGEKSLQTIPDTLKDFSDVDEIAVYRTGELAAGNDKIVSIREKLENGEIAAACFFSPSAAENFIKQFGAEILHQTIIATIGKTTAEFFEMRNLKVGFISPKSSAEDFAVELIEYLIKGN